MKKRIFLITSLVLILLISGCSVKIPSANDSRDKPSVSQGSENNSKDYSPILKDPKSKTVSENSEAPKVVILKLGDKGEKVKELQRKLNKFKYNLTIDGEFGASTDFAVRNFQSKVKVTPDGIAGPETFRLLDSTPAKDPYIYKQPPKASTPARDSDTSSSSNSIETFINSKNCPSNTEYYIYTSLSNHTVSILTGSNNNWKLLKSFICSVGTASTPTIRGHFTVGTRGNSFVTDNGLICKYYTQISGNYLFHSVLYNKSDKLVDGRLGYNISHGCIRLSLENAKYIYDNIPSGTAIWIQ